MKSCLITGTNKGLGLAFTKWACDKGYHVFATSRHEFIDIGENQSNSVTHIQADLSESENAVEAIKDIIQDIPLDFIIHNAGQVDAELDSVTYAEAQSTLAVNMITPIFLTRALISNIKSGEHKKVIFIGSVSGVDGNYLSLIHI